MLRIPALKVPDRSRNVLRVDVRPDGAQVFVPFWCDLCGVERACYGDGGDLLCTACWLARLEKRSASG